MLYKFYVLTAFNQIAFLQYKTSVVLNYRLQYVFIYVPVYNGVKNSGIKTDVLVSIWFNLIPVSVCHTIAIFSLPLYLYVITTSFTHSNKLINLL